MLSCKTTGIFLLSVQLHFTINQFIKTLCSDEYQMNCLGPFYPVTKEAFRKTLEGLQGKNEKKEVLLCLLNGMQYRTLAYDPIIPIALEEAGSFFTGDRPADMVAEIVENRVKIYLAEQHQKFYKKIKNLY